MPLLEEGEYLLLIFAYGHDNMKWSFTESITLTENIAGEAYLENHQSRVKIEDISDINAHGYNVNILINGKSEQIEYDCTTAEFYTYSYYNEHYTSLNDVTYDRWTEINSLTIKYYSNETGNKYAETTVNLSTITPNAGDSYTIQLDLVQILTDYESGEGITSNTINITYEEIDWNEILITP